MIHDKISPGNTISRYCGATTLSQVTGYPTADAYKLSDTDRKHNPPYLSFNWLEYFKGKTEIEQIDEIRIILNKKMRRIGTQARLALLAVEEIHKEFKNAQENPNIELQHLPVETPEWNDPSHCGLFIDIDQDEDVIAALLAQVPCKLVPAKKE